MLCSSFSKTIARRAIGSGTSPRVGFASGSSASSSPRRSPRPRLPADMAVADSLLEHERVRPKHLRRLRRCPRRAGRPRHRGHRRGTSRRGPGVSRPRRAGSVLHGSSCRRERKRARPARARVARRASASRPGPSSRPSSASRTGHVRVSCGFPWSGADGPRASRSSASSPRGGGLRERRGRRDGRAGCTPEGLDERHQIFDVLTRAQERRVEHRVVVGVGERNRCSRRTPGPARSRACSRRGSTAPCRRPGGALA